MNFRALAQGQAVKASVGGVEHSKTVLARLDLEKGKYFPIHQLRLAEKLRHPGTLRISRHGIAELPVAPHVAIEQYQRHFVLAAGQMQIAFHFVANDVKAE